ncbi:helix-turn-helix transcriptional regulator [Salmonella enterica]|nr:XRE family transcriptional regulator [Salmonella enterica subsp. enterica serovar Muenchen]EBL0471989.1 XRE family transcriptional regulator [Salmonella enterica]EBP9134772.1 helix-turn-helix transcriptional regulator [Salmonella enterica subsp. enterica]EBW1337048.1 XRE family transcriptional regulator [Salmonella enterica subsp. enterica serovar Muenchen]ECG2820403.1 XRE family transcriptional regulator [Salmonella enterica subsp. enterica serovar Muenchen]
MLKDVLRERRIALKMKQSEVAEKIGVKTQTYMKWENGIYEPKVSYISKLADVLLVSEREICKGELNESQGYDFDDFMMDYSYYQRIIGQWMIIKALYDNLGDAEEFKKDLERYKEDMNDMVIE